MNTNENSGILFKIFLYLKNKFDPKEVIPEEVETCVNIVLKVLDFEGTELIFSPVSHKRFIINDNRGMAITIQNRDVHIINHVYSYTIFVENNECYVKIIKKFNEISEIKRIELEKKLSNNIKHSLTKILEGFS
jgi:hypothetical protein